jgi:DNA invertase Pin-like site-specific DNA recombinase
MIEDLSKIPKIRCAIYTRKSSEEGLEQDFNSLDAQRASAENFIASQISKGWVLLPNQYNDGGISGGTMERPALQRLFQDIRENKVDCVIVYKADRLSRRIFDFAQIIELFDQHKVSFISVTESFNTATAAGRLMFGMIMGFAQYERELTGERIRDKVDASKKKGMWMGGTVPFGYDVNEGKLTINEDEAKTVFNIFRIFIETESVTETARELNKHGFTTKSYVSKTGNIRRGKKFTKQSVRRVVENPLYVGKMKHKDRVYDGLHKPIINEEIWQKIQIIFGKNPSEKVISPTMRMSVAPLLKGIMSCGICGSTMTPTYTTKSGVKYRYYICAAKHKGRNDECAVGRITAKETENLVVSQLMNILKKPEFIVQAMGKSAGEIPEHIIINHFKQIEKVWDELFPIEQARIINLLIKDVEVKPDGINISLFKQGLSSLSEELTN